MSPQRRPVDPTVSYMGSYVDRSDVVWEAPPGITHILALVPDSSSGSLVPQYVPTIFDSWKLYIKSRGDSKEELLRKLRERIAEIEAMELPNPNILQGMPKIGEKVWVMMRGNLLQVTIDDYWINGDKVGVMFGHYYRLNGSWFWTKEEAEQSRVPEEATL